MSERGTAALRLALFAVGLAVLAGVAALVGRASGIDVEDDAAPAMEHAAAAEKSDEATGLSDTAAGFPSAWTPPACGRGSPSVSA